MTEDGRARWLTHEEIAAGAVRALDDPAQVQLVGDRPAVTIASGVRGESPEAG
jgi:hypothetical protein